MSRPHPTFRYAEGVAPFGEIEIVNSHDPRIADTGQIMTVMAAHVIADAWRSAHWLPVEALPADHERELSEDRWSQPFVQMAQREALRGHSLRDHTTMYAVNPPLVNNRFVLHEDMVGFASVREAVSGTGLQRIAKRILHPEKVYADTVNVAVRTAKQRQGIGVALLDAGLANFPDDMRPTMHIPLANSKLIVQMSYLGYETTDDVEQDNLFRAHTVIPLARMQAESVGGVRDRLARHFPWLKDAELVKPN